MPQDHSIPTLQALRPKRRGAARREPGPQMALGWEAPPAAEPVPLYRPIVLETPHALEIPLVPEIPSVSEIPAVPESPIQSTPLAREPVVYSVRQLIAALRQHIEGGYAGLLLVEGEVSNCRPAASGHLYFTLKDGDAQLPVVMFRRQAQLLGLKLKDGMAVEVRGRISVYETRGQLQLIAEALRPRGTGALQLAFEQMRDRLRREGLFDRAKQPLPPYPHCIGIVTSPHGAALRDMINVIRRRHARLNLLIYPAVMQGAQCPASVAAGIRWFNRHPERVDLIVVARGGGSLEDLAGFNDETLARTIVASALPVVSAIGHEIDNTVADYVADLRAPTPSAAAELVTAAQHRVEEHVEALAGRVRRAGQWHLMRLRQRLQRLSAEQVLARVRDAVGFREQRVDELALRLLGAAERCLRGRAQRLAEVEARLRRNDPSARLARSRQRLSFADVRLHHVATQMTAKRRTILERAGSRLAALSPLAVLERGYAIVYAETAAGDRLLRQPGEAPAGTLLRARLAGGSLRAIVTDKEQEKQEKQEKEEA